MLFRGNACVHEVNKPLRMQITADKNVLQHDVCVKVAFTIFEGMMIAYFTPKNEEK